MIPGLFPGKRNLEGILEKSMIKAWLTEDKGARHISQRQRGRRVLGMEEKGTGIGNVEMKERDHMEPEKANPSEMSF